MSKAFARGACPGLSAPMSTGDGLLARLVVAGSVPLDTFVCLCDAARMHGNGIMEISARGSLQVRGLNALSAPLFAAAVEGLGIDLCESVPVLCDPLPDDPSALIDSQAIAAALRHAIAEAALALAPKVSVVIDGGGRIGLDAVPADIRPKLGKEVETDRALRHSALEWIKEHPSAAIRLIPLKIWHLWAPDGEGEWSFQSGYSRYDDFEWIFRTLRVLNQLFYIAIVILFFITTIKLAQRSSEESPLVWLSPILVLYTTLISVVFSGQSRFHFPAIPWMIMFASWLMIQWLEHKQSDGSTKSLSQ